VTGSACLRGGRRQDRGSGPYPQTVHVPQHCSADSPVDPLSTHVYLRVEGYVWMAFREESRNFGREATWKGIDPSLRFCLGSCTFFHNELKRRCLLRRQSERFALGGRRLSKPLTLCRVKGSWRDITRNANPQPGASACHVSRRHQGRTASHGSGALRVGQAHAVVRPGEGVTVGRRDGELSIDHHGSGVRKRRVTELAKMETLSFSCASQAHTTTREQSRAMGIMHLYLCYPLTLANTVCVPRQYAWWWHT
jgi:hypothetical protein